MASLRLALARIDVALLAVRAKPWLGLLFLVGLGYVAFLLAKDYEDVLLAFSGWSWRMVLAGLLAGLACALVRALYRLSLYRLSGIDRSALPARIALRSYAWGQLMRYIPGKLAGPATEASLLHPQVGIGELARITIFEMLAMLALTLSWLGASFAWIFGFTLLAIVGWLCAMAGLTWLHAKRPLLHVRDHGDSSRCIAIASACTLWLGLEWIFFYCLWWVISGDAWFPAATSYAAASWVGTMVFVAPAGLGVREASYAFISQLMSAESPADALANALVARALLTLADVMMPLLLVGQKAVEMSREGARGHWENLSQGNTLASTIDPTDLRGLKNTYISKLRDATVVRHASSSLPGGRALDFGCGHGDLDSLLLYLGYEVVGLDITQRLLSAANRRPHRGKVLYVRYDGTALPFRTGVFDMVVSYGVLIYLDDEGLRAMLRAVRDALRPGGAVLFIEQCRRRPRWVSREAKHHRTIGSWKTALLDAGFELDQTEVVRHGHMPLLYLIRWGMWPRIFWGRTIAFERWLGKRFGILPGDYADVAFRCSLRIN